MISSTIATLEWAAQVSRAASRMHITGSPVMAPAGRAHAGRALGRLQRVEQDVQRQQHQPQADGDAAEVLDPAARAAAERDHADDEQRRRGGGDVERQQLHDQRRADVGAEQDGQGRDQADERPAP